MRLKSMNKSNSITLSRKNNSTSSTTTLQPTTSNNQETNYEINSSESGYLDLNMDSGDVF